MGFAFAKAQPGLRANWTTKLTTNHIGRALEVEIWNKFKKQNQEKKFSNLFPKLGKS